MFPCRSYVSQLTDKFQITNPALFVESESRRDAEDFSQRVSAGYRAPPNPYCHSERSDPAFSLRTVFVRRVAQRGISPQSRDVAAMNPFFALLFRRWRLQPPRSLPPLFLSSRPEQPVFSCARLRVLAAEWRDRGAQFSHTQVDETKTIVEGILSRDPVAPAFRGGLLCLSGVVGGGSF
jgi:hypothetical protein